MSEVIFKLADQAEWDAARGTGLYGGSAVDRADGYIHFSTRRQLPETARKHYARRAGLVLAVIDMTRLGDVRWEPSRGGALFPHLYGDLPFEAVLSERKLSVGADGSPLFEDGGDVWP